LLRRPALVPAGCARSSCDDEPGLVEMLQIPGLGPKKIKALNDKLGVTSIAALTEACHAGRIAELDGFGAKTQEKILAGIKNREAYGRRHLWWEAWAIAEPIVAGLRALPGVKRAEAAGSLRRGTETIGDLDFLVASTEIAPVVAWFTTLPQVREIHGARGNQGERAFRKRSPSRSAHRAGRTICVRPPSFYRIEGSQCSDASARAGPRAQLERVGTCAG